MTHVHSHSHAHDHSQHGVPASPNRAFAIAVSLNFLFTSIEAVYAIIAHSMSLLADAGHNFGDVLGLLLSWGAAWLLTKPATDQYSYGFKKTTVLSSFANALLLVLATGIIAYESILRLLHPGPVTESIIIVVALAGIVINGGTALLFFKGSGSDLNIKSAFYHLAGDAVIALGVVITGIIVYYTKLLWLDPFAGLLIVVAILVGTWGLIRDSVNLMLDAVPRHIDQEGVREYLAKLPGVETVHDLHIWGLSTREVALTAHLVMPDAQLTDQDFSKVNEFLQHHFHIKHITIQVERGHIENPCGQVEMC